MIEGNLIVLEGIDGSGTSTQAALLGRWHRERGLPVLVTHEPTDGPIGSIIRQVLTNRLVVPGMTGPRFPGWATMALLFAADRLDHLEAVILPNLHDGVTVISDRYDLSSLAYQSATCSLEPGDPSPVPWLRSLNSKARRPDLTIVLDVSHQVAARRREERALTAEVYEDYALQEALAETYLHAESLLPEDRIVHVDGNGDVETVHRLVVQAASSMAHSAVGT